MVDRVVSEEAIRVKPDKMQFDELMLKIRNGQIRIPDFQREFVWERSQIIRLLDSVYHHFPVGSFLFWQTDDEIQSYRRIGEIELRHDQGKSVQYVLDGQQRLTSLFACLEQARITHRVNGKKVTKSLQIYFDLDEEQFVPDPLASDRERSAVKLLGLPQIGSTTDYLALLVSLLRMINKKQPSPEHVVDWLVAEFKLSVPRARRLHRLLQPLGLYTVTDEACSPTESGHLLAQDENPRHVLRLLVDKLDYFSDLFPALATAGETTEEAAVALLAEAREDEIKPYHVRCRLKWLAGLGLGSLKGIRLLLSKEGQAQIDEIAREAEIQDRDRHEEEADKRSRYFSVREITDVSKFVDAAARLGPARRAALVRVQKRFISYPFSTIDVLEQPIDTACEIFERINNSGKILNVVDLMVAKTWSPAFNLRDRLNEFREELAKAHYDDVPDITILQCVAGILTRAVRRKNILDIDKTQIQKNWNATLESIRQAIDFLKGDLRITHARILPYNSVVVPLTYFFHAAGTQAQSGPAKKTLGQWFWKVSASSRYDSAAETRIGDDIADMERLAGGDTVIFTYATPLLSAERIIEQRLNLGSAFCKTLLCVLNYRGPRELKDGSPVSLTSFSKFNSAELHHLLALLRGSKTDPQRPLPTDPLTTDRVRRRPTKLSHLIEDVTCEDGLRLLPRPTARSKALPDDQLVPEEGVLHTGLLMVARVLLPLSPSSLLHLSDRAVARGRSWSPSRHGGCPGRWNDDRRATRTRSLVDATRVVGRVRREAGDVAFDLVDQIEGRRRVVNMPAGQGVSDDHARSVDAQMKLLPAASTASAMFHGRPFTFTHSREPGTVDDEMYACARGEAAKCKVEVLTTP